MTRVLAVVAHPDDEVLGVGGTLLRHKAEGDDVSAIVMHRCVARTDAEQIEQMQESSRRLGIPVIGGWLGTDLDVYVKKHKPDIVYAHSRADLHHDHQDALQRTLVACRPQSGVRAVYCFETPSATDWSGVPFTPQRYVDIGATIEQKMHAMDAYDSELRVQPHPRNLVSLYERAAYWGQRAGVKYAEPFEVVRECW